MSDFKPRTPSVRGVIKDLCPQCRGLGTAAVEASRTLGDDGRVAIGYRRGDCPECSGTGWIIEISDTVDRQGAVPEPRVRVPPLRRGRPIPLTRRRLSSLDAVPCLTPPPSSIRRSRSRHREAQ